MLAEPAPHMQAVGKSAFRRRMRHLLKSLPLEEKERQSRIIAEKLIRLPKFAAADRVSIYLNTVDEVATTRVLQECWNNGKTVFVPRYDPGSRDMRMLLLRSMEELDELPLTAWNIRQPATADQPDALQSGGLHLIVVPGLAFTLQSGYRLGSGRGYYDRYFEKLFSSSESRAFLVGLAFAQQVLPDLPVGPFDVPMDLVITCDPLDE